MEVKQGYKYTEEFGYIPEDWELLTLKSLGFFSKGKGGAKKYLVEKGNFIIRYGEIYTTYNDIVQEIKSTTSESDGKIITVNDVLFAGSGETKEEIGKCITLDSSLKKIKVFAGGDIVIFSCKQNIFSNYLVYLLNSFGRKQIDVLGQGDAVVHIYPNQLQNVIVSLPPIQEQEKIAQVLRDMDKLIGSIESLLEKKRNLKIATMQKLLTPQPHWEEKRMGEVCQIRKGMLLTKKLAIKGCYPVIAGGKNPAYYNSEYNRNGKTITISASGASAGYVWFHNYPLFASDCSTISESREYCITFLYYWLLRRQKEIYKLQTGGAQPHVHPNQLNELVINLPKRQEQQKIAQILSDMDEEIDALEKELEKYRLLKTGTMQELLTGKTRLL